MGRFRRFVILLGAAAAAAAVVRHVRGARWGPRVPGGILVGDAVVYDALAHRLVLGSLFGGIAADVACRLPSGPRRKPVRRPRRAPPKGKEGLQWRGGRNDPMVSRKGRF